MPSGRSLWACAALLLAGFAPAGCGGADRTAIRGQTLRLTLDEYRIVPQDVTIAAGRVHVVVRNAGRVPHNVEIEGVGHTHIARPGAATGTWLTLRPGTYRMSCEVSNHDALGQWGTIHVVARRSAAAGAESVPVPGAG